MANQLVLAVAGAGKTTKILSSLNLETRSLILTYTNSNFDSLNASVKRKFGHHPPNIEIYTYFSFLYGFCFRPYCSYALKDNGYRWKPPQFMGKGHPSNQKNNPTHYQDKYGYLYSNRVAKYLINFGYMPRVLARIDCFFDQVLIEEIQDFGAHDFDFVLELAQSGSDCLFVGDFHQHTFETSNDGQKNINLYKKGVSNFIERFRKRGFEVDTTTLEKTHRCTQSVCDFITEQIGIPIDSNRAQISEVRIVETEAEAISIFENNDIVKLFYAEHYKYPCFSNNWGRSKGLDHYTDVCVVLNQGTQEAFNNGNLKNLNEITKHKLYVACSRARGNLYLMDEQLIRALKRS